MCDPRSRFSSQQLSGLRSYIVAKKWTFRKAFFFFVRRFCFCKIHFFHARPCGRMGLKFIQYIDQLCVAPDLACLGLKYFGYGGALSQKSEHFAKLFFFFLRQVFFFMSIFYKCGSRFFFFFFVPRKKKITWLGSLTNCKTNFFFFFFLRQKKNTCFFFP